MLTAEPTESTDAIEPADPIDRIEPADPIDRIEPVEPMDRIDPLDPMLKMEPPVFRIAHFPAGPRVAGTKVPEPAPRHDVECRHQSL
jgi:hypothetical protein